MTLFNIAIKNVRKNFYNYFLYFVSMILSIIIYYTFTTIQYNEQVLQTLGADRRLASAFQGASFVIAIFVAIFIWYSNTFFTRKRKKEVGLYSMLGVKKKQIGRMLFYENIIMGVLALAIGIFLGSLLSKVFVMLLFRLMGFSEIVKFTIVFKAMFKTCITFSILFLITSIHGYSIIYRFKLIELFKADSTSEKEPKASVLMAVLSIVLIGTGYYIYTFHLSGTVILMTLALVVIGTYLLFSFFMVYIIKLSKKNKGKYYKGINMIGTSQLLYRIKSNSRTLATIAVLSASTLTAMGVVASYYYDFSTNQDARYPFSYTVSSNNDSLHKKVEEIMAKYPKNKIERSVDINYLEYNATLPDVKTGSGTFKDTVYIISESKFKELAKVRRLRDTISLNDVNEAVIYDSYYNKFYAQDYKNKFVELNTKNENMKFKIVDFKGYNLINGNITSTTLIVKDEIYSKIYSKENVYRVKAYINKNQKHSEELTNELLKFSSSFKKPENAKHHIIFITTYYMNYKNGLTMSGLMIFISSFLGLVFLAATGSIIFFKQISEANDDRERYRILKNIGVNKKEIKASISNQIFFLFASPLIVGIIHSLVAVSLLNKFFKFNLMIPIGVSIGIYTLIYMFYYALTVRSYNSIVN